MVLVLLAAIAGQFVVASLIVGNDEIGIRHADLGRRVAEQVLVAERIVEAAPPERQAGVAALLSSRHLDLGLVRGALVPAEGAGQPVIRTIREAALDWEPALRRRRLAMALSGTGGLPGGRHLVGGLEIAPGTWLTFRSHDPIMSWSVAGLTMLRLAVAALIVLVTTIVLVRTLNRPLRRLSEEAKLIGTRNRVEFEERGPQELRRVSHALNEMQQRIDDLIAQRTQALAAVGHDLRTPLTRLRLRLGAIDDAQERAAAQRDIADMNRMLQELLDFFDSGDPGDLALSDLASLCQTVADDFTDMGADVTYAGPDRALATVDQGGIARALSNLVDNAVKYAGSARIVMTAQGGRIAIAVEDDGPGIPPDQIERMRLPFERLEPSRGGSHSGIGLGLSIVEQVAARHGGTLRLEARPAGGTLAVLDLPATPDARPSETL